MLLPIRSRVLHFVATKSSGNADTVMEGLKSEYGTERQFTRSNFIEHLVSLKENGLLDEVDYGLDEDGNILINYQINQEGIDTINKYLPKKWHV